MKKGKEKGDDVGRQLSVSLSVSQFVYFVLSTSMVSAREDTSTPTPTLEYEHNAYSKIGID